MGLDTFHFGEMALNMKLLGAGEEGMFTINRESQWEIPLVKPEMYIVLRGRVKLQLNPNADKITRIHSGSS